MRSGQAFHTTHWSVVLAAKDRSEPGAAEALERLCCTYWYPLYAHVRRQGHAPPDAEDLTQGFFARLLEKEWLRSADSERGRFRSFLLASLRHFLSNERDRERAQKRGGGRPILSLDGPGAEERLRSEPAGGCSPQAEFDRRWALTVLGSVLDRLEDEHERKGKAELFRHLRGLLAGGAAEGMHEAVARELGMAEGAVRVAAHRLRRRYRELLRREIAQTVASPEEVEDELQHLFSALAGEKCL